MITLYSGTPGSGKSLHAVKLMSFYLKRGKNVIANFPIKTNLIRSKKKGDFVFKENEDLTVNFLVDYALKNHEKGKESQTLLVIDEAQSMFNPRDFARKDRKDYNYFFSLHRKLGYKILLITQNDRLLDRQIRCQLEYEVKHRKVNNFKTIGALLPFATFCCITRWYGVNEKISSEFFVYNKKLGNLYDSFTLFDLEGVKERFKIEEEKKVQVKVLGEDGVEEIVKVS